MEHGYTFSEQASIDKWVEALSQLPNTKTFFTRPKASKAAAADKPSEEVKSPQLKSATIEEPPAPAAEEGVVAVADTEPANINLLLLELAQYSNPELISHSLLIMKRLYDQRRDNINQFYDICFVESGSYYDLAEYTLKRREKFFTLLDQNTLKIDKPRDANSYHFISKEHNDER